VGAGPLDAVLDGTLGEYPLLIPIGLERAVSISRALPFQPFACSRYDLAR
jgi:hypothetical protein